MNRIFLTGDKHGDFYPIINFIEKYELGYGDWIIVLGDMGLYWRKNGRDAKEFIEMYENNYEVNLMFIDGNHENFDLLKKIEIDEKGMGYISKHITYLSRGCSFELCGNKFLCMGGADSVDKFRRIEHLSWWRDEKITEEDIAKVDKKQYYDYVLTHAAPQSIVNEYKWKLCMLLVAEELIDHSSEQRLEEMLDGLHFGHWYFGHYHADVKLNEDFSCLYNDFIELT